MLAISWKEQTNIELVVDVIRSDEGLTLKIAPAL